MKVSRNFLNEYVDISDLDIKKIADDMTSVGNEYASVGRLINATGLTIGKVISCKPHPDSDHLKVCQVDVSCFKCGGKGCSLCKNTGWIELLGAGMVHPNVLKCNGYDPEKYKGFAFGTGIDRLAMMKYNIPDIRLMYTNDIRFLKQFDRKELK